MAYHLTETISHFIGYLRLTELLNLPALHYRGAPDYAPATINDDNAQKPWTVPVDLPPFTRPASVPDIPTEPTSPIRVTFDPPARLAETLIFLAPVTTRFGPPPQAADAAAVDTQVGVVLQNITVSYVYGFRQDQVVDINQRNVLEDSDVVLDARVLIENDGLPPAVRQSLEQLVELAESLVPDVAFVPFDIPDGVAQDHYRVSSTIDIDVSKGGGEALEVDGNGTFIDGVQSAAEGQDAAEQSADLMVFADRILQNGDLGSPRETPHTLPNALSADGELTPKPGQEFHAGGNDAVNVAIHYDLGDAFGSRIIRGDYHEINVIVQVNVLRDVDTNLDADNALVAKVLSETNVLRNEASFLNLPGDVSDIVPTRGFSGATTWKVDYVQGHFLDMSTTTQHNYLDDLDFGEVSQTQAYHLVTFGENDQLNLATLTEIGKQYDLIIIGGDYYKYNAILQFNILYDDDALAQFQAGNASVYSSNGNLLENDAAIVNVGGQTFHSLNDDVTQLADGIANGDTTLDPYITLGLPGNGDGVMDVLYISGNAYALNLIVQSNIVADLDVLAENGDGSLEQIAESGGNATLNGALIYDVDSQSDYQFLGGEVYETSFLVQSNIIVSEDETAFDDVSGLSVDAVAVVAALSDHIDTTAEGERSEPFVSSAGADVMGGMLG